jgi:hypothetical protein
MIAFLDLIATLSSLSSDFIRADIMGIDFVQWKYNAIHKM